MGIWSSVHRMLDHGDAARILTRAAGEGDRRRRWRGRPSLRPWSFGFCRHGTDHRGGGRPLHHPADGPPPPFHGGGYALAALAVLLTAAPALAHPHVWVEARARVLFDKDGRVDAIHNDWVFDEMYSAFAVQGLAKDGALATPKQLAPLAKTNVESLKDFDFFTYAKVDGRKIAFGSPVDYSLEERPDKRVVLHFTLPLIQPTKTGRYLTFQVYDPTYFVDFELAAKDPVALADAPAGCSKTVLGVNPLIVQSGMATAKTFDSGMTPSDDFALKMASRTIVACP